MPTFISYISYSQSGVQGLLKDPNDRAVALQKLLEDAGGSVVAFYMTTGQNDVILISRMPDEGDAVAVGMAVSAAGSVSKVETVRAWSSSEFVGVIRKASQLVDAYTPPGG